jgi:hypothetical protein
LKVSSFSAVPPLKARWNTQFSIIASHEISNVPNAAAEKRRYATVCCAFDSFP